jgi:hypothetical protein
MYKEMVSHSMVMNKVIKSPAEARKKDPKTAIRMRTAKSTERFFKIFKDSPVMAKTGMAEARKSILRKVVNELISNEP